MSIRGSYCRFVGVLDRLVPSETQFRPQNLEPRFSNLIQIVKMRTSAGFIPSYSAGTLKSRDRTNPPVTANILYKITQRWGAERTKWAVELMFDDLFVWNTWMFARRREAPLGLLSWGSNPYPYAPDGTGNGAGFEVLYEFRRYQSGQPTIFSGTYIITIMQRVYTWFILQLSANFGPTGTFDNSVPPTKPRTQERGQRDWRWRGEPGVGA